MSGTARRLSLQFVVLGTFLLLTFIATTMVGVFAFRNSRRAVNEVSAQLRVEIDTRIQDHLKNFFRVPRQLNRANAVALARGALDPDDPDALMRHFHDQVSIFESVTSINFGNRHGGLANSGREGAGGERYEIVTVDFAAGPFLKYAVDRDYNRVALVDMVPHFDARERPWYQDAVARDGDTWSEVYLLATGQDMSFSVSRPVYRDGDLLGVVGVNLFVSHVNDFLATVQVGESGQSFIMERSGMLIAASTGEQPFAVEDDGMPRQQNPAVAAWEPLTAAAAEALSLCCDDLGAMSSPREFVFFRDGVRYFGRVSILPPHAGPDWLIVTVIPESDFMDRIHAGNRTTIALIGLMLLVISGAGLVLTHKIIGPVANLTRSVRSLADGEWRGETLRHSRIREISVLSDAFFRMAEQLQHTIRALALKNQELEQVVYVASHDLRSPLVNIDGYSRELIFALDDIRQERGSGAAGAAAGSSDSAALDDAASALSYIRKSVVQMDALLSGLLKLSRFGRAALNIAYLDMNALVRDVADAMTYRIQEEDVELIVADLPPCRGDAVQLKQVFSNLLDNALKYREPQRRGKIMVSGATDGTRVRYVVEDNGIGIAPAHQDHIFEVFHRLDPGRTSGEGLGLSIARQILGRLDGEIRVDSVTGEGSRFTIELPAPLPEDLDQGARR